jgi:hypothetical protein
MDVMKFIFLDPPTKEEEKEFRWGKLEKNTLRDNFLDTKKSYLDVSAIAVMSGDVPVAGGEFWMTYSGYFDGTEECPQVYGNVRFQIIKQNLKIIAHIFNVPKELFPLKLVLVIGDQVIDCGDFSKEKNK